MSNEQQPKNYDYINQSRGHKTKGNTYKDRYVEVECPECKHMKAYKDEWTTRIAYTCMKRSCRKKWYVSLTIEEIQAKSRAKEEGDVNDKA